MKDNAGSTEYTTETIKTALYTKNLILIFAVLFSTLAGMVLLMMNLHKLGNRRAFLQVLAFGLLYTAVALVVLFFAENNTNIAILINIGGAYILTGYFWNRHIGKNAQHPPRNWVKPLVVVLVIIIGYILYLVYFPYLVYGML